MSDKITYNRYRCSECNETVDSIKEMDDMMDKIKIPYPGPCPNCSSIFKNPNMATGRIEDLKKTTLLFEKTVEKTLAQHSDGEKVEE